MSNTVPPQNEVSAALVILLQDYLPATKEDATIYWSSAEIAGTLSDHTGQEVSNAEVFMLMTWQEYSYAEEVTMKLSWMLKKKEGNGAGIE
jgi:hypothetical protein